MKFTEAEQKLNEIAGNEYRSIRFEKIIHYDGEQETNCELYINGEKSHCGATWEEAFANRESNLGLHQKPIEQSPDI